MKIELSYSQTVFYFSHLYKTNPSSFKDINVMTSVRNPNYTSRDYDENDFIIYKPGEECKFTLLFNDSEIEVEFCTVDTKSAGIWNYVRLFQTNENKENVNKLIMNIYKYNKDISIKNGVNLMELKNGVWYSSIMRVQTIEHLYINNSIWNDIKERIDRFHTQKERFFNFGKSWKLNILLSGIPGSGKTSFVKGIAHYYKKLLYVLQLNPDTKSETIINAIKSIESQSILLIEDIDSYFKGRETTKDNGLSFSTFINILDGASGQHNGLITFVTANYPETLDKAILRPGRIDHISNFDYPKKKEIRMAYFDLVINPTEEDFETYYKEIKDYKIPMSGIVDYLFLFGEKKEDIFLNLKRFVEDQQVIRNTFHTERELYN